jgi:lipoprotein-anchoring transpeptidase ErfK/SrfK
MCVSVCRRLGGLAAAAVLGAATVAAVAVPAAQASPSGSGVCDQSPLSQPFLAWGDSNLYKLAPAGDFETAAAGWSLSGSAAVVPGSEPAGVTGTVGASSLRLPTGGSAQSPGTCVNSAYPRLRFFARSDTPASVLQVSVVYPTVLGDTAVPVGTVVPGPNWTPTTAMPTLSAIALLAGGTAPVQIRFTELTGSSQVDDVFVDPHTMH